MEKGLGRGKVLEKRHSSAGILPWKVCSVLVSADFSWLWVVV